VNWFPDIEVAVVAHNSLSVLPATLDSLVAAGCPAARITVVDVKSDDGTGAWLAERWPEVRVRRLDRNDGPCPGRNIGITEATSRFVLLMDPDVQVLPDTVAPLYAAMLADPTIKVGSPIVVHLDRPDSIQYAGGALHYICEAVNPWLDRPIAARGTRAQDIGVASACALLLDRQAAIEVGLFDERYFMGKDDGDFTHRVKMAGYTIWEMPESRVLHRTRPRSRWLFYYQIRNRWHFILKNYQLRTIVGIVPVLLVHEPLQFLALVAEGHGTTYLRAIGGLLAMLPALPRDRAFARRIRRRSDAELLVDGPLVVRADVASRPVVRRLKEAYEQALDAYWRLLRRTLLAR
jgi:hypothetical protein